MWRGTREALGEMLSRHLSDLKRAVVMIDGIELAGMRHVVALGITADGTKASLSLLLRSVARHGGDQSQRGRPFWAG